jgi:hypothetical protein
MTADELSPDREGRRIAEMLRERGVIDPGRLGPVIDLAALGLVSSAAVACHPDAGQAFHVVLLEYLDGVVAA